VPSEQHKLFGIYLSSFECTAFWVQLCYQCLPLFVVAFEVISTSTPVQIYSRLLFMLFSVAQNRDGGRGAALGKFIGRFREEARTVMSVQKITWSEPLCSDMSLKTGLLFIVNSLKVNSTKVE
jgi:hypothetical protein